MKGSKHIPLKRSELVPGEYKLKSTDYRYVAIECGDRKKLRLICKNSELSKKGKYFDVSHTFQYQQGDLRLTKEY